MKSGRGTMAALLDSAIKKRNSLTYSRPVHPLSSSPFSFRPRMQLNEMSTPTLFG